MREVYGVNFEYIVMYRWKQKSCNDVNKDLLKIVWLVLKTPLFIQCLSVQFSLACVVQPCV